MQNDQPTIAFFAAEPWEETYLRERLAGYDLAFFPGTLAPDDLTPIADTRIISLSIHPSVQRDTIERLPRLELIATRSTGFDHIDLTACDQRGIYVSNVPYYGENTVAEHTFGLMLSLSRNIHKAYLRTLLADFSLKGLEGFDLKDKTLGVVGAGSIGLHVIRIAKGFGMKVLAYDLRPNHLISEVLGFDYVSLDELFPAADILTLHAPHTPETHHLINRERIATMKKGVLLINTARGGLVDTDALIWGLDTGIIGGAGLDVIEGEELIKEEKQLIAAPAAEEKLRMLLRHHVLLRREDVVITPHVAFYSKEALQRIVKVTADNILGFLHGQPQNVVNHPRTEDYLFPASDAE